MATATEAIEVEGRDIDIEEVPVTHAALMAGAHHIGTYCDEAFRNFMGCRYDTMDPKSCLEKGKLVTQCTMAFFTNVKQQCNPEFTEHWTCLDKQNLDFGKCRKTQQKYDSCMLEKMNIERSNKTNYRTG